MASMEYDYFISYTHADEGWARWVDYHLTTAGKKVIVQFRDFPPSSNFILKMDEAMRNSRKTIAILSPDYLEAPNCSAEWAEAIRLDPTGKDGRLIPIMVRKCDPAGLLGARVYLKVHDFSELEAQRALMSHLVEPGVFLPAGPPVFPGMAPMSSAPVPVPPSAGGRVGLLLHLECTSDTLESILNRWRAEFAAQCKDDSLAIIAILPSGPGPSARARAGSPEGGPDSRYHLRRSVTSRFPDRFGPAGREPERGADGMDGDSPGMSVILEGDAAKLGAWILGFTGADSHAVLGIRILSLSSYDLEWHAKLREEGFMGFRGGLHPAAILDEKGKLIHLGSRAKAWTGWVPGMSRSDLLATLPDAIREEIRTALVAAWNGEIGQVAMTLLGREGRFEVQAGRFRNLVGEDYLVCFIRPVQRDISRILSIVNDVALESASNGRLEAVFHRICGRIAEMADHATLTRHDAAGTAFEVVADWARPGTRSTSLKGRRFSTRGNGGLASLISDQRPVIAPIAATSGIAMESREVGDLIAEGRIRSMLIVPMILRGTVVGTLSLGMTTCHRAFFQDDLELFRILANLLAVAAENSRLTEDREKREARAREEDALKKSLTSPSSQLERVADGFLKELSSVIRFDTASLQMLESGNRFLAGSFGFDKATAKPLFLRPISRDRLILRLLSNPEPLIIDTQADQDWTNSEATAEIRSWMGIVIRHEGQPIALITLDCAAPSAFSQAQIPKVLEECGSVGRELVEAFRKLREARKLRTLVAINSVVQEVGSRLVSGDVLDTILKHLFSILEGSVPFLYLRGNTLAEMGGDAGSLVPHAAASRPGLGEAIAIPSGVSASTSPIMTVYMTGRARLFYNANYFVAEENLFSGEKRKVPRALVAAPIRIGERTVGVLGAYHDTPGCFWQSDLDLVKALAAHAGLAIEKENMIRLLSSINRDILLAHGTSQVMSAILRGAVILTHADVADIYLFNAQTDAVPEWLSSEPGPGNPLPRMGDPNGLTNRIISLGKAVVIEQVQADKSLNPLLLARGWNSLIGVPLRNDGQVVGVLYVCDRKVRGFSETEKAFLEIFATQGVLAMRKIAMREDQSRYRSLVEAMPFYLFRKDKGLRFTFINKAFLESTGRKSDQDVLGRTDLDLYGTEIGCRYQETDKEVLATKAPVSREEAHFVPATGETIWVQCTKTPVLDPDGEVAEVQGVFRDVTQEKELRNRYMALVEQSPFGILVHKKLRIQLANPAALEALGLNSQEEAQRFTIFDLIHPADRGKAESRQKEMEAGKDVEQGIKLRLVKPSDPGQAGMQALVYSRRSNNPGEIQVIFRAVAQQDLPLEESAAVPAGGTA